MFIINHRKIFFGISGALVLLSIIAMLVFGFTLSIEFTGGTIVEVSYSEERPGISEVRETLSSVVDAGQADIRNVGDSGISVRLPFLGEEEQSQVVGALAPEGSGVTVERVSSIGPTIGEELRQKALIGIAIVIVAIILFVAFAFRKVAKPVSSWKYGLIAVVALVHDTLIPAGVFAVLGYYFGYQLDVLFVTAVLTILGYSVNDTIVVFDRIRENLRHNKDIGLKEDFDEVVGRSLSQTYVRSINTSLTTLLVLIMLLFVGGESIQHFALVLVVGIISGAYSSIFLASPLLVWLEKRKQ